MIDLNKNFYILSGAPGAGKSTLIKVLRQNFRCVDEPAREIIFEQRAIQGDGTSDRNQELFVELLLSRSISHYNTQIETGSPVFFDRGIPDIIAYADHFSLSLDKYKRASACYRYNEKVFFLSPWKSIYKTDSERKITFEETIEFSASLKTFYEEQGYSIVEVPLVSPEMRCQFILAKIQGEKD